MWCWVFSVTPILIELMLCGDASAIGRPCKLLKQYESPSSWLLWGDLLICDSIVLSEGSCKVQSTCTFHPCPRAWPREDIYGRGKREFAFCSCVLQQQQAAYRVPLLVAAWQGLLPVFVPAGTHPFRLQRALAAEGIDQTPPPCLPPAPQAGCQQPVSFQDALDASVQTHG